MPVVINEFEVVPDAGPTPHDAGANGGDAADPPRQKEKPPFDEILRLWRERAERVRAH